MREEKERYLGSRMNVSPMIDDLLAAIERVHKEAYWSFGKAGDEQVDFSGGSSTVIISDLAKTLDKLTDVVAELDHMRFLKKLDRGLGKGEVEEDAQSS